jgi:4-methyl-5(b-hydroxyethyl)-thiazole monophosphate biosynthesis
MPSVLIALPEGFEELEAVAPIDLLRRAGAEVVIASLSDEFKVTGRNGIRLFADTALAMTSARNFDCLLLPGGPGVKQLRADPRVIERVQRQFRDGHWIAAICAAPTVLKDAGLIPGIRFTAHPSVASELPDLISDQRVVRDGRIITSRGAGTAIDFGLEVVSALHGETVAQSVSTSICA